MLLKRALVCNAGVRQARPAFRTLATRTPSCRAVRRETRHFLTRVDEGERERGLPKGVKRLDRAAKSGGARGGAASHAPGGCGGADDGGERERGHACRSCVQKGMS